MTMPSRKQSFLLPPSIDEFVGPGHRARVIVEVCERLDLSGFDVGGGATGRPAYPAEVMVPLILYAFSLGVLSSREIARRCETDCAFMFVVSGLRPGYRTIARFRAENEGPLSDLFSQVVVVCRRAGLGSTAIVAYDGTRQKANASLDAHESLSHLEKELERLRKEFGKFLEQAAEFDAKEDDDQQGEDEREGVAKLDDATARIAAIESAIAEMDAAGVKEANSTDPDARLQRLKEGNRPGYNAQVGVEAEDHLIVAADVTQAPADTEELVPMVEQTRENTGEAVGVAVADSGYESGESFKKLVEQGQDAVVSAAIAKSAHRTRKKTGRFQWVDFDYDPLTDRYLCPAGEALELAATTVDSRNGKERRRYAGVACEGCALASKCVPPSKQKRTLDVLATTPYLLAMSERRRHDRQRNGLLGCRKGIVEGVFGHLKHNLRWRQFTRRGLTGCRSEFRLLCAASNLSKLTRRLGEQGNSLSAALV